MMHIHASLRAAHAAHLRQQVAIHAAAVAAALPPPQAVVEEVAAPSPATLFGGLFSPGAPMGGWELCAACSSESRFGVMMPPLTSCKQTCAVVRRLAHPISLLISACCRPVPAAPDADELAAACGMFISPAKTAGAAAAANKPRKLFVEEAARPLPAGKLADLPADLSPALWVQAA